MRVASTTRRTRRRFWRPEMTRSNSSAALRTATPPLSITEIRVMLSRLWVVPAEGRSSDRQPLSTLVPACDCGAPHPLDQVGAADAAYAQGRQRALHRKHDVPDPRRQSAGRSDRAARSHGAGASALPAKNALARRDDAHRAGAGGFHGPAGGAGAATAGASESLSRGARPACSTARGGDAGGANSSVVLDDGQHLPIARRNPL